MSSVCHTIEYYSSVNGAMPLLYSIRDCIPFAFSGLLFVIFVIIFAAQYYLIKNRTARAKILLALVSSSFVLVLLSLFLALTQLVTYMNVIFYAFVSIISFILLLISDDA